MRRSWSLLDFVLVWLGGFIGVALFVAVTSLVGNTQWIVVMGVAGQYAGSLGVLWALSGRRHQGSLGFSVEPRDVLYIGLGLLAQIILVILFQPLADILLPEGHQPQEVAEVLGDPVTSSAVKLTLLMAAVLLAPLTEELVFRGVLLQALRKWGRTVVVVVTSAAFAAVHILGLDTEMLLASAAVVLPPVFILGLLLAWITLRTGRLGPAIFLHSGYNLLAVLVLLIPTEMLEQLASLSVLGPRS